MVIVLYSGFKKRLNSTKWPVPLEDGVTAFEFTGHLKEPCSVLHPVVSFQSREPTGCTYAYINKFARYYFITDWTWENGLWVAHMDVDVLASFKLDIGRTSAYIERCASESNGAIIDRLYPFSTNVTVQDVFINAPWTQVLVTSGCYILGIISGATSTITGSAVTYYALTYQQVYNLINYLLGNDYITDSGFPAVMQAGQQLTHDVAKALLNPIQYIVSCIWFPFSVSSVTESTNRDIKVGYYTVPTTICQGKWIHQMTYDQSIDITLPRHPQSGTRGKFLNYAPYSVMTCYLPPFGEFPVDTSYFDFSTEQGATDTLRLAIHTDLATGKSNLRVRRHDTNSLYNNIIYETSAMFGVPIQLAQVANDMFKATTSTISTVGNIVGTVGGIAVGNPMMAVSSGLMTLQSIGNAIEAQFPQVISQGANGSFSAFNTSAYLTAKFYQIVDEDNTENGRPLCAVRQINTLTGYIRCGEVTIDYQAYSEELESIHSLLLSGFFWE